MKKKKTKFLFGALIVLVIGVLIGSLIRPISGQEFEHMSMHDKRMEFISEKEHIMHEMMMQGDYKCCLEKPCTYCIEKAPGHGEGAACHCLVDIMESRHPCGECIGEIIEGHGNKYLAYHFAQAIAEEVGEQHKDTLKQIIAGKYDITVEQQV